MERTKTVTSSRVAWAWAAILATVLAYAAQITIHHLTLGQAFQSVAGSDFIVMGNADGLVLQSYANHLREWGLPFDVNVIVPTEGLFNFMTPLHNVWLNPGWLAFTHLNKLWGVVVASSFFCLV